MHNQNVQSEFNPEMLTLARESRGLTQLELAEAVGITQSSVSKFENGLQIPSNPQLQKFAMVLGYFTPLFFLHEPIRWWGSGCTYR